MKHPRFMVIDPDGSVIVVRQDVLRNDRPTVWTKYALRGACMGSSADEC
jgi:hypothetical protein